MFDGCSIIRGACRCLIAGGLCLAALPQAPAREIAASALMRPAADRAALDDPGLSCTGALRQGSTTGVAEFSGRYLDGWPGMQSATGYDPGPYAAERPLLTVTQHNMGRYAAFLTEGQQALLQRYPAAYRVPLYPSHRDFRVPASVCQGIQRNARRAAQEGDASPTHPGPIPFPQARHGAEALRNVLNPHRANSESATVAAAQVAADGAVTWFRGQWRRLESPGGANAGPHMHYRLGILLPDRLSGYVAMGFRSTDADGGGARKGWLYLPGLHRVRQLPDGAGDATLPAALTRVADEIEGFDGRPADYDWTLSGRRELFVPYHNFKVNDPDLPEAALLGRNTLNPDLLRYERHRVWVLSGTPKPGVRLPYARQVLYVDEDSWRPLWVDAYDVRGVLWRTSIVSYFYAPQARAFHRGVTVRHDLQAGSYEASLLVNGADGAWWTLNEPGLSPAMFRPDAMSGLARQEH